MRSITTLAFIVSTVLSNQLFSQATEPYWPKQTQAEGYIITLYEPEPEKFEHNILDARIAFNIWDQQHLPVFGAMWISTLVQTNTPTNEVHFTDITVQNINFPNATAAQYSKFKEYIELQAVSWHFNSDLKAFYAKLQPLNIVKTFSENLLHNPPKIMYASAPSILVYIDGEPRLASFSSTELYKFVVNSPYFIVFSESDKQYYLNAGMWWFMASGVQGPWKFIETPPVAISRLAQQKDQLNSDRKAEDDEIVPPAIIAVSEPAELIQTMGEPEIEQIHENLFSISNSPDEIIFDSYKDDYYLLISGRWYKSKNLERGPWSFVLPSQLPEAFRTIPASSPYGHLRMSVPGTAEAASAVLDNGIPQTAIISREKARMSIKYDGEPVFEQINGTGLKYAVNTMGSVIQSGANTYYAVDQGIWFVAETPTGPWKAATSYPEDVKNIPPSFPVFNLKFVRIYDYSDEVVFTGYTQGYLGAFSFDGVVVYGTGYRYKSWYGDNYIPGPNMYNSGVAKKPKAPNISFYASSGYGMAMAPGFYGGPYGAYGMGIGMGYGVWPYGYGMNNQYAYNQHYYAGQSVTIDHDPVQEKPLDLQNIYNNRKEGIIITETVQRNDPMKPVMLEHIPEDLYTDKDGKIYQMDRQGNWLVSTENGWVKVDQSPKQ